MNLLEFITWCELKDIITHREKVDSSYDVEADAHYKIKIDAGGAYHASVVYATLYGQAVIVSAHLYKRRPVSGGFDTWHQPDVGDLVRAFCNES